MIVLHVSAIILTLLFVVYSDEQGLLWILGKKETLDKKRIRILHCAVSIGLSLVVLTGGLMFLSAPDYYISNPVFIAKMIFVLMLVINAFVIGSLTKMATQYSFASLSSTQRTKLLASGAVSGIGWLGALLAGLTLAGIIG